MYVSTATKYTSGITAEGLLQLGGRGGKNFSCNWCRIIGWNMVCEDRRIIGCSDEKNTKIQLSYKARLKDESITKDSLLFWGNYHRGIKEGKKRKKKKPTKAWVFSMIETSTNNFKRLNLQIGFLCLKCGADQYLNLILSRFILERVEKMWRSTVSTRAWGSQYCWRDSTLRVKSNFRTTVGWVDFITFTNSDLTCDQFLIRLL